MTNLYQLWNKPFANAKSLEDQQQSKYCAKNNKTEEYWWVQNEEEFRREEKGEFLDSPLIQFAI